AGAFQISFCFFGEAARIAIVGFARNRIDDGANQRERWFGVKNIDPSCGWIRDDEHIGSVDHLPTANTRAIETEAVSKNIFVIFGECGGEMLPGAGEIGELEIHEFYFAVLDHFGNVGRGLFIFSHGVGWSVDALMRFENINGWKLKSELLNSWNASSL